MTYNTNIYIYIYIYLTETFLGSPERSGILFVYVCMYVCMYACMYVRVWSHLGALRSCLCMHVCVYACMYVCMYACRATSVQCDPVCVWVCMYTFVYLNFNKHAGWFSYVTGIHTYVCVYMSTHRFTHTKNISMPKHNMYVYGIHTHKMYVYGIHTHTYTHTCMYMVYTRIHTQIHKRTHAPIPDFTSSISLLAYALLIQNHSATADQNAAEDTKHEPCEAVSK
jgi:hypothetical protein